MPVARGQLLSSDVIQGRFLNDLFVFNPATLVWAELSDLTLGAQPPPRYGHGFHTVDGRLYLFGGQGGTGQVLPYRHFFFALCSQKDDLVYICQP